MKRGLYIILIFVLLFSIGSFVIAQEDSIAIKKVDDSAKKIEDVIDETPINQNTGDIEFDRVLNKTKAEERIEDINSWLSNNASWLKIVFGMVPEISWLFAINLYFWMLFLVILILNGNITFSIITENKGKIIGGAIFVVLLVLKLYLNIAKAVHKIFYVFWEFILPLGAIAFVIVIALVLLFIALLFFAPRVLVTFGKMIKANKEKKEKERELVNREALEKIVKESTSD